MAERTEIASEIEGLAVHCRTHVMEAGARALWLRDWCEDLAEFKIDHIRMACRVYRQSGKTKFPTPGELIPLVRAQAPVREQSSSREEPWRELSDFEFEALSLSEKVRHHRILAHEARRKAGPMWRNGRPLAAEEMPEIWRSWNTRAEGHDGEANRLQSALRRSQAHAAE